MRTNHLRTPRCWFRLVFCRTSTSPANERVQRGRQPSPGSLAGFFVKMCTSALLMICVRTHLDAVAALSVAHFDLPAFYCVCNNSLQQAYGQISSHVCRGGGGVEIAFGLESTKCN